VVNHNKREIFGKGFYGSRAQMCEKVTESVYISRCLSVITSHT